MHDREDNMQQPKSQHNQNRNNRNISPNRDNRDNVINPQGNNNAPAQSSRAQYRNDEQNQYGGDRYNNYQGNTDRGYPPQNQGFQNSGHQGGGKAFYNQNSR